MNSALTEDYFRWLAPQIRDLQEPRTYDQLTEILFRKEFIWLVAFDDNRLADGNALRNDFCHEQRIRINSLDKLGPVSFLEVLIGLARRLSFAASGTAQGWAWRLVGNLELHAYSDPLSSKRIQQVENILDDCVNRTYQADGQGGFFPLAWPQEDQRQVEIWYQMAAYINEIPEH